MREILFRGKRADNGEWIISDCIMQTFCIGTMLWHNGYWKDVATKTVGQYTGLTDKNGKKIFEGDIVAVNIKGHNTVCTVNWAETVAQYQLWQIKTMPQTATNINLGNYDTEVIGNIYDNPELLEVE